MIVKIIALVIGILLIAAGIMFSVKEKEDPESRKIYTVTAVIGAVITIGAAVMLIM